MTGNKKALVVVGVLAAAVFVAKRAQAGQADPAATDAGGSWLAGVSGGSAGGSTSGGAPAPASSGLSSVFNSIASLLTPSPASAPTYVAPPSPAPAPTVSSPAVAAAAVADSVQYVAPHTAGAVSLGLGDRWMVPSADDIASMVGPG